MGGECQNDLSCLGEFSNAIASQNDLMRCISDAFLERALTGEQVTVRKAYLKKEIKMTFAGLKHQIHAKESQIQQVIIDYIKLKHRDVLCFHIPNAGKRSFQTGMFFKKQGLIRGIPDLCLCWGRGHIGFIEVKTPTGRLTNHQKAILDKLTELHIPNAVCRSLDDVVAVFRSWGL